MWGWSRRTDSVFTLSPRLHSQFALPTLISNNNINKKIAVKTTQRAKLCRTRLNTAILPYLAAGTAILTGPHVISGGVFPATYCVAKAKDLINCVHNSRDDGKHQQTVVNELSSSLQ